MSESIDFYNPLFPTDLNNILNALNDELVVIDTD